MRKVKILKKGFTWIKVCNELHHFTFFVLSSDYNDNNLMKPIDNRSSLMYPL